MARIASQALGGFFKTQDEVRPLIYRHFAAQTVPGSYCVVDPCAGEGEAGVREDGGEEGRHHAARATSSGSPIRPC